MVIFTDLDVGGTSYNDNFNFVVRKTTGEFNSSSSFEVTFDNRDGSYSDTFSIGDEVTIIAEKDVDPPTDTIFLGTLENIKFAGMPNKEIVILSGRDFTARLMDATIPPTVFNNSEISTIVTSIVSNNTTGITTTNVDVTPVTLSHITFKHLSVYDALKQLADLAGFYFYVDISKDLHFELKGAITSTTVLNNTNVTQAKFKARDDQLYNEVWVYGGRQLTGFNETFTADGGSVYNLQYKPRNTNVLVGGSTQPKIGGIFEMITSLDVGSPTQYLVDFDQKSVIFISGTNTGDHIPVSGTDSIIVGYDRTVPIVKLAIDPPSQTQYGKRSHVIVDETIDDPNMAADLAVDKLNRHKDPAKQGDLVLQGVSTLNPGDSILVNLPNQDIDNEIFDIMEVMYDFTAENVRSEEVILVRIAKKVPDILDTIKQMMLDIKKLKAGDSDSSDLITRFLLANGSLGPRASEWSVSTRSLGSSFVLGNATYGDLGSGTQQVDPQTYLGDSRGVLTIVVSGGETI